MGGAAVRPSVAAACLAVPPLALALAAAAMLVTTALGLHPLWPRTLLSPAEAVMVGDDAAFVRLVTAGANPNGRTTVGPGLGREPSKTMTPLEAAVVRGREQQLKTVSMMGATVTGDAGRNAVCLAYEESPELVPVLWGYGAPRVAPEDCRPE
jgi:hypothetical protein